MPTDADFDEGDLARLRDHGIPEEEARRQISILRNPPAARELLRPCTLGDGIERIAQEEMTELVHVHREVARAGRLVKFVPASGAATRMFQDLEGFRASVATPSRVEIDSLAEQGDEKAGVLATFLRELRRFPFFEELRDTLAKRGRDVNRLAEGSGAREILDALLGPEGMGYLHLPKALIKFHRYEGEARTAFEEHLVEAAELVRAADSTCRLHFTISSADGPAFDALLKRVHVRHERKRRAKFLVRFTTQQPRTDTLALDADGKAFRDGAGGLLFRPGGHGALLGNLNAVEGDIVHIKNIDNVPKESLLSRGILFRKLLVGRLAQLQVERRDHTKRLERAEADASARALDFARRRLNADVPTVAGPNAERDLRQALLALFRRPLRVCGVVRNTGEPGGAPFWVRGRDGAVSVQIVEGAEVDPRSEDQRRIHASSTHFNPTDMVLGLTDAEGARIDLSKHADPSAVILTRKSSGGRDVVALERPGLWNGGMAGFSTVLVEIPGEAFTPVKTVLDLLREEHQAG